NLTDNSCRVRAGVDVLMPGENAGNGSPTTSVTAGRLQIGELQRSAKRLLQFAMISTKFRQNHSLPLYAYTPPAPLYTVDQPAQTAQPQLTGIFLNGVPLAGFSPLTSEYTLYSKDTSNLPTVTATADPAFTVQVIPAAGASRSATILVSAADGALVRYRVYWSDDPDLPLPEGAVAAQLNNVTIKGQAFLPFYPTIFAYTLAGVDPAEFSAADFAATTPPGVTASVSGPVGGVFTVRAESADHARDYTFAFTGGQDVYPVTDEFSAGPLGAQWTVDNQSSKYSKEDGHVQIITEGGEWYQTGSNQHNTVWQRADGDWTADVKFDFDIRPYQSYHQLGVVVYQDQNNFLAFQLEYNNWNGQSATPFEFAVKNETNGTNSAATLNAASFYPEPGPGTVYFRIVKAGTNYKFYASNTGAGAYTQVGTAAGYTKSWAQPKFGLQSLWGGNGSTTDASTGAPTSGQPLVPITVKYDYARFQVTPTGGAAIPTAPVVAIADTGSSRVKLATTYFNKSGSASDGIRPETCSGACSGQDLGYGDAGQYVLYNLDVARAGYYNVVPQTASSPGSSLAQIAFSLSIDGELATTFHRVGGTGGWQNWERMPAQVVYLHEGINKLRLSCDTSSFNYDYLDFEPNPVDRTVLHNAIAAANQEVKSHYTTGSWNALQSAVAQAKTALLAVDPTPAELSDAAAAVDAAVAALVGVPPWNLVDVGPLAVAVALSGLYESQASRYTPESYAPLAEALAQGRDIVARGQAPAITVDQAIAALQAAVNGLVEATDTSVLEALIAQARQILDNPADYVSAKLPQLQAALDAARAALAQPGLTQDQALAASIALAGSMSQVHARGDKSGLAALIAVTEGLDSARYTPASWAPVITALAAARTVNADPEASVFDVSGVFDALDGALRGLLLSAAKAGLVSAMGVGEAIAANSGAYVPASIAGLPAAMAAARDVNADPNATTAQVTAAQTALVNAIAGVRLRLNGASPAGLAGGVVLPAAALAKAAVDPAAVAAAGAPGAGAVKALKAARPKIAGQAVVGKKLRAKAGAWTPAAHLAYQWYRGGKAIAKATKAVYKVKRADRGKKISVKVTGSKSGYAAVTKASAKKKIK
ncbi:MAG: FIVAR domain-containing protein, partial [Bifidobacteriaceae bacterium]|nr:FIVAR domain-containing protein [Bifidobacteriaceae bacterium]